MISELLTARDVAQILRCSEDKVIRVLARMDGVIDLGRPENPSRRRYRVLRIPRQIVERYLTQKAGRSVTVEVPDRAERRRRSPQWESRAALNLAKAGVQNGLRPESAEAKKIYRRVAERARLLTFVPPESLARGRVVRRGRMRKRFSQLSEHTIPGCFTVKSKRMELSPWQPLGRIFAEEQCEHIPRCAERYHRLSGSRMC